MGSRATGMHAATDPASRQQHQLHSYRGTMFPPSFMLHRTKHNGHVRQAQLTPGRKKFTFAFFADLIVFIGMIFSRLSRTLRNILNAMRPSRWLAKSYSLQRGVHIKAGESLKQFAKISTAAAALLLLAVLFNALQPDRMAPDHGGGDRASSKKASSSSHYLVQNSGDANSQGSSANASTATSGLSAAGSSLPGTGSPAPRNPNGSTAEDAPLANVPGVTSPYTITIPGTSVGNEGKQIIGTGPVSTTLN